MLKQAKFGATMALLFAAAACGQADAETETAAATPAAAAEAPADESHAAEAEVESAAAVTGNVVEVRMFDDGAAFKFEPETVEVKQGDVVRFVFAGTQPHNVEFDRNAVPGEVDLGENWVSEYFMTEGQTYEITIDERFAPGTYGYFCTPHISMGMTGELVVQG